MSLDPRLALVFLISSTAVGVISNNYIVSIIFFVFHFFLFIRLDNIKFRYYLTLLFFQGISLLVFYIIINYWTIEQLVIIIIRFWLLTTIYLWFYNSITPEEIMKALIWFKIPYKISWTIVTSYRYIFLFKQEVYIIKNSLVMKGIPLDGNILQRLRYAHLLLSPLFIRMLFASDQLSEVLFAKNWTPWGTKGFLHPLKFQYANDFLLLVMYTILVLTSFMILFQ